jgi:outer membrane protein assembly factor BamA
VKQSLTPQAAGTATQRAKFILGDLEIDGDVHDRNGARDRVLKASQGREYANREELTNEAAERIRADFQKRGYFQVVVQIPSSQPVGFADGEQSLRVIASITEGDQFRLKNIRIQSGAPDKALSISAQTLRGQFHLRDGDLFNMAELREGLERLQDLYVNRGYAHATAIPDTSIDTASHLIELTIRITEGPHTP